MQTPFTFNQRLAGVDLEQQRQTLFGHTPTGGQAAQDIFPELNDPIERPPLDRDRFELDAGEEGLNIIDIDDVFAPLRGIEGLIRSVGDLAGIIPGIDDPGFSKNRFLGRSTSVVGGFVETLTQFVIPFGGAAKGLKAIGFLGRGIQSAKAGAAAANASRLGLLTRSIARSTVAGGFADFVAFEGHEARLSDLVESMPGLSNTFTEYLATDENDTEFEGRLKNLFEGAILGVALDGLMGVFRATKTYRNAISNGATREEALESARNAAPKDEQIEALRESLEAIEDDASPEALRLVAELTGEAPDKIGREVAQARAAVDDFRTRRRRFHEAEGLPCAT